MKLIVSEYLSFLSVSVTYVLSHYTYDVALDRLSVKEYKDPFRGGKWYACPFKGGKAIKTKELERSES